MMNIACSLHFLIYIFLSLSHDKKKIKNKSTENKEIALRDNKWIFLFCFKKILNFCTFITFYEEF